VLELMEETLHSLAPSRGRWVLIALLLGLTFLGLGAALVAAFGDAFRSCPSVSSP
jgi:hypothetical protein